MMQSPHVSDIFNMSAQLNLTKRKTAEQFGPGAATTEGGNFFPLLYM